MNNQELVDFLQREFSGAIANIVSQREKRVFAETTVDKLVSVAETLKEKGMHFLGTITGLDGGAKFEVIYHLYNDHGLMLNLKVFTPRDNPKVPTITSVFPGAFLYERELMDLLGIQVEGTPEGRRYPLPDDWPAGQYPLRKDWQGLPPQKEVKEI
jgi:membrane-bound hydrogenase subunit beta